MNFDIIDFHTHPFTEKKDTPSKYAEDYVMKTEEIENTMKKVGINRICGSVIETYENEYESEWAKIKACNEKALKLRDYFKGFYIPGFHVHPHFIEESINEITEMKNKGVNLIGEIVPRISGWSDYSSPEFSQILEYAGKMNMIVNLHTWEPDAMDKMVEEHKDVVFVMAHPGKRDMIMRHINRMQKN